MGTGGLTLLATGEKVGDGFIDGWIDGWMDVSKYGCMDGWMDGWVGRELDG